jgi:leader peptidase (prepilin peptidase) / N-methyltransferase
MSPGRGAPGERDVVGSVDALRPISDLAVVVLGLVIGSFANVCIYRLPRELSVVRPRSRCPACDRGIPWYENIPVLSFLLLGGRCRGCGVRISARYPLVEAGMALVSWVVFLRFGLSWTYLFYFFYSAALLTLSVIDFDHRIIPDKISLYGLAAGLVLAACTPWLGLVHPLVSGYLAPLAGRATAAVRALAASGGPEAGTLWPAVVTGVHLVVHGLLRLLDSLAGALMGGGFLWLVGALYEWLRKQEGIGGGDIKLLAMVGAFTGWQGCLFTIFGASLTGSIVGVALMIRRRSGSQTPIPFGPFLSLASFLYVLAGDALIHSYLHLLRPQF